MTRYADPERCPDCLAPMAYGSTSCPSCGLPLEGPLAARLFTTLTTADEILAELRAPAATAATVAPTPRRSTAAASALDVLDRPATVVDPSATPPAPPTRTRRHTGGGMSAASVPKILLGLGALCLLVAALVFLAVSWSEMGVGGRTATLVGLTAVAGGLAAWAARRDLRAAAESLGVVALGLLAFDLFGARDAGWLGDLGTPAFLVVLGAVLLAAGSAAAVAVRRTPVGALSGAEVVAALGGLAAAVGTTDGDWFAPSAGFVVVVVAGAAVTAAAHALQLRVLTAGAGMLTTLVWVVLALSSLVRAAENPSLDALWLGLEAWPLVVAATLAVAAPATAARVPHDLRLLGLGTGLVLAALLVLAPAVDESATTAAVACSVVVLLAAGLTRVAPRAWRPAAVGVHVLGALGTAAAAYALAVESASRVSRTVDSVWSGSAGDLLPDAAQVAEPGLAGWTLPLLAAAAVAAVAALAHTIAAVDRLVAPLADLHIVLSGVAGTVVLTVGLYPVPLWLVVALLLVIASGLAARGLGTGQPLPLALGVGFLAAALVVGLHAESLTLVITAATLALAVAVHLRWSRLEVAMVGGAVLAAALAGTVWTGGTLLDGQPAWTALAVHAALAVVVLTLPYVDEGLRHNGPGPVARLGVDVGALVVAVPAAAAGVAGAVPADQATWLAVYLTLAGATASALALLRPDRRVAGWVGGVLLAAATWVRLADIGVDTPEAYTLPSALALLAVGIVHLRRHTDAGTLRVLSPGLGLALLPSLLWVLADPVTLRSLLLGAACLALVVGGVRLRWSAPVLHGALVGTLLVLRHATPLAEAVPRWALIGTAGVLLVALGVTWERRLRDARAVAGYVRHLR